MMKHLKRNTGTIMPLLYAALMLITLSGVPVVECQSPYIISDSRVRSLDITPALGRGYSIMTNSFQSICLMVDETTVPSYNYDYSFYDFSKSTNLEVESASKMSYSFGYYWFRGQVKQEKKTKTNTSTKTRYINASMRIERYYSSVREEVSPLSDDAAQLINGQDYVGFFKACGPNYVRGIRRAQEVTAFFIFRSSNTEKSTEYSRQVQVSSWWWRRRAGASRSSSSKFNSESKSMRIVIKGFGLGLTMDGSETFVAQTLEDYQGVMDFAFHTMTRIPESFQIGMVYGMEIVPWVENTAFQVASNLLDEAIEIPIVRSMIPRAFQKDDPTKLEFDNTSDATREKSKCKEPSFEMDKYGYCCEAGSLYDTGKREYSEDNPSARVCRPLRMLEPTFIKDNLAANGEFVARLDRSIRYKLNQLSTLERCISAVRAIPQRYDYYILKSQDTVKFDGYIEIAFSVFELKMALDPFNDYAMLKHMANELDEFLEMYIQPCYAALFGGNIGSSPDTDPSYFMAYPWHNHDVCTKLSCLANSMRWDRSSEEGGCVPSLIAGADAPDFVGGNANCKKDIESGVLKCKHDTAVMDALQKKTTKIWKAVVPRGRVDYFMDHFCMPSITGKVLDRRAVDTLRENYARANGVALQKGSVNVALGKPCKQSTTWPHLGSTAKAGLAVDGNTDGYMWRGTTSHTHKDDDPFWEVELQNEHMIVKIIVHARTDCCQEKLKQMKIIIYKEGSEVHTENGPNNIQSKYEIPITDTVNGATVIGVVGDKVRIEIPGPQYLHLAEVEVMNEFLIPAPKPSP